MTRLLALNAARDPIYLPPEQVLREMAEFGSGRARTLTTSRVLVLSVLAGGFITVAALFAILLAAGQENEGLRRLLEGFGFSAGFFFVILSGAVLFTEINVEMPAVILEYEVRELVVRIARLWLLAWLGNAFGAWLVGWAVHVSQHYSGEVQDLLVDVVATKMQYRDIGGVGGWFQVVISGMLGNWLVGMAAFFAVMGRTIIGKYIPVFLAVTLFVAANFQHSPANMGFFGLIMPTGDGPGWGSAFTWNLLPAGIGNIAGGALLVALPLHFALDRVRGRTAGSADV